MPQQWTSTKQQCTRCPQCKYKWTWAWRDRCHQCHNKLPTLVPPAEGTRRSYGAWNDGPPGKPKEKDARPASSAHILSQALTQLAAIGEGESKAAEDLRSTIAAKKQEKYEAKPWQMVSDRFALLSKKKKQADKLDQQVSDLLDKASDIEKDIAEIKVARAALAVEVAALEAEVLPHRQQQKSEGPVAPILFSRDSLKDLVSEEKMAEAEEACAHFLAYLDTVRQKPDVPEEPGDAMQEDEPGEASQQPAADDVDIAIASAKRELDAAVDEESKKALAAIVDGWEVVKRRKQQG